jgi:hypothetical protein
MSSWLLSNKHFQVIHNGLIRRPDELARLGANELVGEKNITKFVRNLAKMNAAGYNNRYDGKRAAAPRFSTEMKYDPSDAQLYKAIDCVCYQSNEGDILKKHKDIFVLTQQIRFMLSASAFCNTKAWGDAPWGIEHDSAIPESRPIK